VLRDAIAREVVEPKDVLVLIIMAWSFHTITMAGTIF